MGNEQSVSGEGDGDSENKSNGCPQQATTSAAVSNGDENSFMPVAGHSSAPRLPALLNHTSSTDDHQLLSRTEPKPGSTAWNIRSHSASSRTPSSRVYKTAIVSSGGNRSSLYSPFATRSLRIRSPHRPARCSTGMDNVGATNQPRTNPSAVATSTTPSARSPRPASMCRQRSAVTFSASVSGAFASSGLNALDGGAGRCAPLASLLGLSAYQQQQIAQSWPKIQQSGGHTAGAEIFRKLTSKSAPIKETFQKADVVERLAPRARGFDIYKDHGRLLFEVFQTAVNALSDPADGVIELCKGYGAKHLSLRGEGFQTRMWDDLSEIMVEHVTRLDAVRRHREVMRAWTVLIMFLVEKMKEGYDTGLRKCSSPVICSPYSHRAVASANVAEDQTEVTRTRDQDNLGYDITPTAGRRIDRRQGSLRKNETVEQQQEIETELEKELTKLCSSDV